MTSMTITREELIIFALGVTLTMLAYQFVPQQLEEFKYKEYPMDRIAQNKIHVYQDNVVIDIKDLEWSSYADTGSMRPTLGAGHNGLEMVITNKTRLKIGDIVSYQSNIVKDALIVHRIVDIKYDKDGELFILKGDSNNDIDPEEIRRPMLRAVLVAIIY